MKFQLVCFMLLGNQEVREFNQMLFNDSITVVYAAVAMYCLIVKANPIQASFWFTNALGVKAGAVLLLPTFLGWIQYKHGVRNLLVAITVIIGF